MKVTATDADEGINSQISYSIVESSSSMFIINSRTGEVMVRQNTLDREVRVVSLTCCSYYCYEYYD